MLNITPDILKSITEDLPDVPHDIFPHLIVDKVREYFNDNNIPYDDFSYDDLVPYLPRQ